jgi:hypothetical protein
MTPPGRRGVDFRHEAVTDPNVETDMLHALEMWGGSIIDTQMLPE